MAVAVAQLEQIAQKPIAVYRFVLENGLTFYLSPNKAKPEVYTAIAVRAGSKMDPPDKTGLAHYLEHLLFKGTDRFGTIDYEKERPYLEQIKELYEQYNQTKDEEERKNIYRQIDALAQEAAKYAIPNEYDRLMSLLGATGTNAFTSVEQTVYINTIPSNQLERWMAIEAERFRNPVLARLFHVELETVYEEKNMDLDSDASQLYHEVLRKVFKKHPYGQQTTIGEVEHLKNPSIKRIEEFYKTYYVPNNMAVILCGDLDLQKTLTWAKRYFSSWEPGVVPEWQPPKEPPIKKRETVVVYGVQPEMLYMVYRLPADPKLLPYLVMTTWLLKNGTAGLIDLNILQQQKASDVSVWYSDRADYYLLNLWAEPIVSLETLEKLLVEQIEKIKKGDFDEALLEGCKRNFLLQETKDLLKNEERALRIAMLFTTHRQWTDYLQLREAIQHITKEALVKFAKKYLKHYVVGYKKKGERKIPKVPKPPITPIKVNRDVVSSFYKTIENMKVEPLKPYFIDYQTAIQKVTLDNGVPCYFYPNEENDLFHFSLVIPKGAWHDKAWKAALNFLPYVHTTKYSLEEIKKQLFILGCSFHVHVAELETEIVLSGPWESFKEGLSFLLHILQQAEVEETLLQGYIERILKERSDAQKDPYELLRAMVYYARFGEDNPYRFRLDEGTLRQWSAQVVRQYIRSVLRYPYECYLYAPTSEEKVKDLLKSLPYEHDLKEEEFHRFVYQLPAQRRCFFLHYPEKAQVFLMWVKNDTFYHRTLLPAATLFNYYFGIGMSALVFQEIREARALAYNTYAVFQIPTYQWQRCHFQSFVATQNDKVLEAITTMEQLLSSLPQSEKALASAKENIKNAYASLRYVREQVLSRYRRLRKLGEQEEIHAYVLEQLPSLDFAAVKDFYSKHVQDASAFTLLIVGDRNQIPLGELSKHLGVSIEELSIEQLFP